MNLADLGNTGSSLGALRQLYGGGPIAETQALITQAKRFMGAPGLAMDGCEMHRKLLQACGKIITRITRSVHQASGWRKIPVLQLRTSQLTLLCTDFS